MMRILVFQHVGTLKEQLNMHAWIEKGFNDFIDGSSPMAGRIFMFQGMGFSKGFFILT